MQCGGGKSSVKIHSDASAGENGPKASAQLNFPTFRKRGQDQRKVESFNHGENVIWSPSVHVPVGKLGPNVFGSY